MILLQKHEAGIPDEYWNQSPQVIQVRKLLILRINQFLFDLVMIDLRVKPVQVNNIIRNHHLSKYQSRT